MKKIWTISFCLFTLASNCWAQPGFMGKKHVLETNIVLAPAYVLRSWTGTQEWNYSIRLEKVTSAQASWVYGISLGSSDLNEAELEDYGTTVGLYRVNPSTSWSELLLPRGVMKYSYQELSLQRRWYFHSAGSVAPYGVYFGLQTDLARMKQTTGDLQFYDQYDEELLSFEPVESRGHFAISESMVVGNRRMIGKNFTMGVNAGLGYIMLQTSRPGLANQEVQLANHMDLQENVMVRHFAMRKTIQLGLSVGYLF